MIVLDDIESVVERSPVNEGTRELHIIYVRYGGYTMLYILIIGKIGHYLQHLWVSREKRSKIFTACTCIIILMCHLFSPDDQFPKKMARSKLGNLSNNSRKLLLNAF